MELYCILFLQFFWLELIYAFLLIVLSTHNMYISNDKKPSFLSAVHTRHLRVNYYVVVTLDEFSWHKINYLSQKHQHKYQ